jgi:hypothetical protein
VWCPIYGTAFHYAGVLGMEKMVKLLLEAGAEVNAEGGKLVTHFKRQLPRAIA